VRRGDLGAPRIAPGSEPWTHAVVWDGREAARHTFDLGRGRNPPGEAEDEPIADQIPAVSGKDGVDPVECPRVREPHRLVYEFVPLPLRRVEAQLVAHALQLASDRAAMAAERALPVAALDV